METPGAERAAAVGPAGQAGQGAELETTVPGLGSVRSSGSGGGSLAPGSMDRTGNATQLAIGADAQQRLQQLSLQQQQNHHQQQQHDQLARDAGAFACAVQAAQRLQQEQQQQQQAGDVAGDRAPQFGQLPPQQQQPHPDCQQRQEQEHQQHRDRQRDRDEQAQQLQQPQHHLHKQAHHQHEPQYQAPHLPAPPHAQHQAQQPSQQSAGSELEDIRDGPHGQGHSGGEAARPAVSVEQNSSASHPLAQGGQSARHKRHRGQQQDSGSTMSQSPAHVHGAQQHGFGGGAPCGADAGGSVQAAGVLEQAGAAAGQGLSRTTSIAVQQAQSLAALQQQQQYGSVQGRIRPDMGSSSGAAAPGPLGQQQYLPQQLQQPAGLSLQQLQHFGQPQSYPELQGQGQGSMLPPGVNPSAAGFPSWLSSILHTQYTGKHGLMQHTCGANELRAASPSHSQKYVANRWSL